MSRLLRRFSTSNTLKSNEYKKWFRISLDILQADTKLNNNGLPPFVEDILEHIDKDAKEEDPYEISPQETRIIQLKGMINEDGSVPLKTANSTDAASLLGLFLSDLPKPLLPTEDILVALKERDSVKLETALLSVSQPNRILAHQKPRLLNLVPCFLKIPANRLTIPDMEIVFSAVAYEYGPKSVLSSPTYQVRMASESTNANKFRDIALSYLSYNNIEPSKAAESTNTNNSNTNPNDANDNYNDTTNTTNNNYISNDNPNTTDINDDNVINHNHNYNNNYSEEIANNHPLEKPALSRENSVSSTSSVSTSHSHRSSTPPLPSHPNLPPLPLSLTLPPGPPAPPFSTTPLPPSHRGEREDSRTATPNSGRGLQRVPSKLHFSSEGNTSMTSSRAATPNKGQYLAHPLWGDDASESEFPLIAPSASTFASLHPTNSSGVFGKFSRLDLERNLLSTQQQLQESMIHHTDDVERLQDEFAEERSRLLHQIAQLQHYAPIGMHVVGETEHQVVNAIDMEMRARRAEREAQVARDEAWKEHTAAQSILGVGAMVDVLKEDNERLRKEIDVLRNALRYSDDSAIQLKDMREREAAANKETKILKEQEAMMRKEMMRLRAEVDALRAQVTRANLVAPDAQDLQVELASVRASIYDAKGKNESLLAENQKLVEENAQLHSHVLFLQKQGDQQTYQRQTTDQIQHFQQQRNQQLLLHQHHQKQFPITHTQRDQHTRSPSKTQRTPFDSTQLSIDLENAENRVRALEQALQNGEMSRQRTALKANLKALYT